MILVLEILPKNKIPLENTSKGTSKYLKKISDSSQRSLAFGMNHTNLGS